MMRTTDFHKPSDRFKKYPLFVISSLFLCLLVFQLFLFHKKNGVCTIIDVFTETVNLNSHQIINLLNANAVKLSIIHDQNM